MKIKKIKDKLLGSVNSSDQKTYWKRWIAAFILFALLIVVMNYLQLGTILTFLWIFPWLAGKFSDAGIVQWLAYLVAAALATITIIGLSLTTSFVRRKRLSGLFILFVVFLSYQVSLSYFKKDYLFDAGGEATTCFAQDWEGKYVKTPCDYKYHPQFHTPVVRATRDIAIAYHLQEKGDIRSPSLVLGPDTIFFDPVTGDPRYYFAKNLSSGIDIFREPGHHPQTQEMRKPITPEIVRQYLKYRQSGTGQESGMNDLRMFLTNFYRE